MRVTLFLLVIGGCAHKPEVVEKTRFVDMQTYKEWGTTKLVPIGRRPLPTEDEVCRNPLWINSKQCERYWRDR